MKLYKIWIRKDNISYQPVEKHRIAYYIKKLHYIVPSKLYPKIKRHFKNETSKPLLVDEKGIYLAVGDNKIYVKPKIGKSRQISKQKQSTNINIEIGDLRQSRTKAKPASRRQSPSTQKIPRQPILIQPSPVIQRQPDINPEIDRLKQIIDDIKRTNVPQPIVPPTRPQERKEVTFPAVGKQSTLLKKEYDFLKKLERSRLGPREEKITIEEIPSETRKDRPESRKSRPESKETILEIPDKPEKEVTDIPKKLDLPEEVTDIPQKLDLPEEVTDIPEKIDIPTKMKDIPKKLTLKIPEIPSSFGPSGKKAFETQKAPKKAPTKISIDVFRSDLIDKNDEQLQKYLQGISNDELRHIATSYKIPNPRKFQKPELIRNLIAKIRR